MPGGRWGIVGAIVGILTIWGTILLVAVVAIILVLATPSSVNVYVGSSTIPAARTDHCYSLPSACGFPDSTNTGVPGGTSLTSSGSVTTSSNGQVIDGLDITGGITVNHNNVTIQNSRITLTTGGCGPTDACGNSLILVTGAYTVTISHVELTSSTGITVEHAIRNLSGGTINVDHAYQHGDVDALCNCGHASISDSYSVIHLAIANDHLENLYTNDETLTADHNTFINQAPQTANIFANTGNGGGGPCSNHLTITDNLLAGGGYSFYGCGNASSDGTATMTVTGNRFARCGGGTEVSGPGGSWVCSGGADADGLFPRGGSFGRDTATPAGVVWTGNVFDDDDSTAT